MINRRTLLQRCFAGLGGAVVAFMPGKKKPPVIVANGTGKVKKWFQPKIETLKEGMEPPTMGWVMSYETRILNDTDVTVISGGTPKEMEKLYDRLIKEFPDKA